MTEVDPNISFSGCISCADRICEKSINIKEGSFDGNTYTLIKVKVVRHIIIQSDSSEQKVNLSFLPAVIHAQFVKRKFNFQIDSTDLHSTGE